MQPVEAKVTASTRGAILSGMLLYFLGRYVFKGEVPDAVAVCVYAFIPGLLAFAAGYAARHTSRPDAPPAAESAPRM